MSTKGKEQETGRHQKNEHSLIAKRHISEKTIKLLGKKKFKDHGEEKNSRVREEGSENPRSNT